MLMMVAGGYRDKEVGVELVGLIPAPLSSHMAPHLDVHGFSPCVLPV